MLQLKRTNDSTRTSWHSAGTVAANELLCQLQAEVLHREERLRRVRMKVFVQNVCICDGSLQSLDWNEWTGTVDWNGGICGWGSMRMRRVVDSRL